MGKIPCRVASGALLLVLASLGCAQDNGRGRHKQLYVVPAPGPVAIDGQLDDWDLSGQIENEIAAYNFSGVVETVKNAAKANQDIQYALLTDASGRIFVHTKKPELVQKRLMEKNQLQAIQQRHLMVTEQMEENDAVIKISAPLQISTSPWGEIQLIYTMKYLEKEINLSKIQIQKPNLYFSKRRYI